MIAGSVYLVVSRRDALRSEHRLDSLLSREAVFLANNLVLVGLAFVVFWGTFFPLISEAVTGDEGRRRAAVVRPLHGARWRSCSSCCRASGRSSPGGGRRWPTRGATSCGRRRPRSSSLVALLAVGVTGSATALIMFVFAAFVVGVARPGAVARRGRAARDDVARGPRARSSASCAATAGATAATPSTSAWRCCSSASPPRRPSSTRATCAWRPGQTRDGRRLPRHLRARRRRASSSATAASSGSRSARTLRRAQGRQEGRRPAPRARLLPVGGAVRLGRARARPLRGRGDLARSA